MEKLPGVPWNHPGSLLYYWTYHSIKSKIRKFLFLLLCILQLFPQRWKIGVFIRFFVALYIYILMNVR